MEEAEQNSTSGPFFTPGFSSMAAENSTDSPSEDQGSIPTDTLIGLILAFSSCFFIGISVIVKKLALKDLEINGGTRAIDGGFGYLRMPKWWFGIGLMGLGELTNFVAYIFAPAILVTPLGVFSIVFTATLSPYFLREKLNSTAKLGCLLVVVGCVIVTLCGPKDREVNTMEELQEQLLHPGFLIYSCVVVLTSLVLMGLVPRFGHKYVMLYITICSCFGSLSVMFCKGVGLAIKQTIGGENEFYKFSTWTCIIFLIACLLIETIYMQKALDLFDSSVFMSVNYVMFTSMVIIASSILYTEFSELGWKNIILTILGFIVNIVALYLLYLNKAECSQGVENPNIPNENDPETPLMISSNKILNIKTTKSSSPLSNINLPVLQDKETSEKLVEILEFNDTIPNEPKTFQNDPQLSLYYHSSEGSYSSRSSVSNNSSLYSQREGYSKGPAHSRNETNTENLCEVPLISELQISTRTDSSSLPKTLPSQNSPSNEKEAPKMENIHK